MTTNFCSRFACQASCTARSVPRNGATYARSARWCFRCLRAPLRPKACGQFMIASATCGCSRMVFLLRDRDGIEQGDATLQLKPLLHFPGPLLWMEIDPSQQFLVTNSREPRDAAQKPGDVSTPPTAQADMTVDAAKKPGEVDPS